MSHTATDDTIKPAELLEAIDALDDNVAALALDAFGFITRRLPAAAPSWWRRWRSWVAGWRTWRDDTRAANVTTVSAATVRDLRAWYEQLTQWRRFLEGAGVKHEPVAEVGNDARAEYIATMQRNTQAMYALFEGWLTEYSVLLSPSQEEAYDRTVLQPLRVARVLVNQTPADPDGARTRMVAAMNAWQPFVQLAVQQGTSPTALVHQHVLESAHTIANASIPVLQAGERMLNRGASGLAGLTRVLGYALGIAAIGGVVYVASKAQR